MSLLNATSGRELTAEQQRELDDEYLASNPLGYFTARIAALLSAADAPSEVDVSQDIAGQFAAAIGQPDGRDLWAHSEADRELQVALDSFSLRHGVAESLVRLFLAVADQRIEGGCLWQRVSSGPQRHRDLVDQAMAHLQGDDASLVASQIFLPPEAAGAHAADQPNINTALNVAVNWLERACELLVDDEMNLNAAHNKIKHGVAVRARADVSSVWTMHPLDEDGNIPLSAMVGDHALPIIDSVSVDVLAQPPKQHPAKPGWELTSLALRPAALLAEAWLMARTHGAIFHLAARRHFGTTPIGGGSFPALVTRPVPRDVLGVSAVGMRWPLTAGRDGGAPRPPVVEVVGRLWSFESQTQQAVIVDG